MANVTNLKIGSEDFRIFRPPICNFNRSVWNTVGNCTISDDGLIKGFNLVQSSNSKSYAIFKDYDVMKSALLNSFEVQIKAYHNTWKFDFADIKANNDQNPKTDFALCNLFGGDGGGIHFYSCVYSNEFADYKLGLQGTLIGKNYYTLATLTKSELENHWFYFIYKYNKTNLNFTIELRNEKYKVLTSSTITLPNALTLNNSSNYGFLLGANLKNDGSIDTTNNNSRHYVFKNGIIDLKETYVKSSPFGILED